MQQLWVSALPWVDWAATGSWMQAWAAFLAAFAVIYAARKGAATYADWLRQKQTERQMDAAERVLRLVYTLKRAFAAIRSPGIFEGETVRAQAKLAESYPGYSTSTPERRKRLETAQVFLNRIHQHEKEWAELHACLPIAKAYFGDGLEAAIEKLWQQQVAVSVAAEMYAEENNDKEFEAELRADLWQVHGGARLAKDKVGAAIREAVEQVEALLVPILRSHVEPR